MRIRALKLGQLRHPYRHLGNTGAALAEKTTRGNPGGRRILPDVLAEAHIKGIVVLRHVAVDVVQAAVPDLHVDFCLEYQLQKLHATFLMSVSGKSLERLLDAVKTAAANFGLALHPDKFQLLRVRCADEVWKEDGSHITLSDQTTNLRSIISGDGKLEEELSRRLGLAHADF